MTGEKKPQNKKIPGPEYPILRKKMTDPSASHIGLIEFRLMP